MPAYMIVTAKIADRDNLSAATAPPAGALVEKFGGRYVLRGPGAELLEGDFGDGASMVISEWPDKAAVHEFWNSPEYAGSQEAARRYCRCARCSLSKAPKSHDGYNQTHDPDGPRRRPRIALV